MKKSEKIYKELSEKYTDEEIAESFVFNEDLNPEEQKKVDEEFRRIRMERLKNMSESDILTANLIKIKLRIKDYFKRSKFEEKFSFSNQLKEYIKITKRSNKEIAENLNIHQTKLSRVINGKENPNVELMYRLEEHSGGELPAFYWWRLYSKELEHKIRTDLEKKLEEAKKVKGSLPVRA
ncbi:MAG: helix-turn-helix transcriptional regulator [Lewinellaceae bacterium]|nr:helix-turn-helix transcriptional regulator [Phaeodactylibacter sp.]MCB9040380.1 helix-turn-helix transcriptional regulator [Lewinellaceae bacterium]